jgi:hypothetical protein
MSEVVSSEVEPQQILTPIHGRMLAMVHVLLPVEREQSHEM